MEKNSLYGSHFWGDLEKVRVHEAIDDVLCFKQHTIVCLWRYMYMYIVFVHMSRNGKSGMGNM